MEQPTRIDPDLQQLFHDVFAGWRADRVAAPEHIELDRRLWRTLAEAGITALASGEAESGWLEAAALIRTAARYAAPVPLAESDILAGWLLRLTGQQPDERPRTAAVLDASGAARRVPWASQVDCIVVLWRDADGVLVAADVPTAQFRIKPGWDLAGQPRDAIAIDTGALSGVPVPEKVADQFTLRGGLARCAQSVGAMERAVELAVEHATTRRQFGRPIAAFQAVQQMIAAAAGETAIAAAATDAAIVAAAAHDRVPDLPAGVARSVVGHAASSVARAVHQVLGAIGTTFEHELHEHTKPLLAWQQEFGSLAQWDRRLTELVLNSGRPAWHLIAMTGEPASP